MQTISTEQPFTEYAVRQVEFAAIPKWLRQGAEDIKANPWSSLLYGIVFALVGMGMSLLSANNPGFFMAEAAGFMLWGRFLRWVCMI
ncbi:hypothetical protein [Thiothrix subterranea]|uniref:hypothetical protein n=1 Tax=Thiothrix subterranea TaxID=2735563 RepID=UPI00280AFBAF|nr:hypothetical protein [Thiothrix subterranea]